MQQAEAVLQTYLQAAGFVALSQSTDACCQSKTEGLYIMVEDW